MNEKMAPGLLQLQVVITQATQPTTGGNQNPQKPPFGTGGRRWSGRGFAFGGR